MDNNLVLAVRPSDLRSEGCTVDEYMVDWKKEEHTRYREDYFKDE